MCVCFVLSGTTRNKNVSEESEESTIVCLEDILYRRLLNRFLKVQLKTWKRKIVQRLGREKKKALREKLSSSKSHDTRQSMLRMQEIVNDGTDNKLMSYTSIKFNILHDRTALKVFKRQELRLLFLAFGMRFPNVNKTTLFDLLADEVMKSTSFANPEVLTHGNLKLLETKGGYTSLLSRVRPQAANSSTTTTPRAPLLNSEQPVRKKRRPNFNPKEEDKVELLRDLNEGKTTAAQARIREQQFIAKGYDVDFKQIMRWYKSNSST